MILKIPSKKSHTRAQRHKNNKKPATYIGQPTYLLDRHNQQICFGDMLLWKGQKHCAGLGDIGIVLKNQDGKPGIYYGMWYGTDPFNTDSYGKVCMLPIDNGAKMHLQVITDLNEIENDFYFPENSRQVFQNWLASRTRENQF